MAAETKDQALDLVAAIFVRAGERVPAIRASKDAGVLEPPDINEVGHKLHNALGEAA